MGRYMQPNPIGLAGGKNPFNYANQNPLNGMDPSGLDCTSANGMTHCIGENGGPNFSLPTPRGFRDYTTSNILYHAYLVQTPMDAKIQKMSCKR